MGNSGKLRLVNSHRDNIHKNGVSTVVILRMPWTLLRTTDSQVYVRSLDKHTEYLSKVIVNSNEIHQRRAFPILWSVFADLGGGFMWPQSFFVWPALGSMNSQRTIWLGPSWRGIGKELKV